MLIIKISADWIIEILTDGFYTFYSNSDDGSLIYIDGKLIVNNDGRHGAREASGRIGLQAGKHRISVGYFQQYGDKILDVSYSNKDAGISKQLIPSGQLFREQNAKSFQGESFGQALASTKPFGQQGLELKAEVKAYPNPFVSQVTITLDSVSGPYEIQIIDLNGRIVSKRSGSKNQGFYAQSINTSSLQKGIYFIRVNQNGESSTLKVEKR